jgi:hypothetical protein
LVAVERAAVDRRSVIAKNKVRELSGFLSRFRLFLKNNLRRREGGILNETIVTNWEGQ